MLRTLEHNTKVKRHESSWFRYFAVNPRVPRSAIAAFDRRLKPNAMALLCLADADMLRYERRRKRGEPTVRLGVGVYRFEEEVPPKR